MSLLRGILLVAMVFLLSVLSFAKDEPIKLSTITNTTGLSSAEAMKLFRAKVGSHREPVQVGRQR
jgi:hypothetical protein